MAEDTDRPLAFKVRAPHGSFLNNVLAAATEVAPGHVRGGSTLGAGYYEVICKTLEGAWLLKEKGSLDGGMLELRAEA